MAQRMAVDGYDVVAFHSEGRAVEGSGSHTHEWNGSEWRFASEANRATFAADPERYAPQYGGECAFAVSLGKEAPGSPRHWRVVDGRLFLMSNPVAKLLFRLLPGRVDAADEQWSNGQRGA